MLIQRCTRVKLGCLVIENNTIQINDDGLCLMFLKCMNQVPNDVSTITFSFDCDENYKKIIRHWSKQHPNTKVYMSTFEEFKSKLTPLKFNKYSDSDKPEVYEVSIPRSTMVNFDCFFFDS